MIRLLLLFIVEIVVVGSLFLFVSQDFAAAEGTIGIREGTQTEAEKSEDGTRTEAEKSEDGARTEAEKSEDGARTEAEKSEDGVRTEAEKSKERKEHKSASSALERKLQTLQDKNPARVAEALRWLGASGELEAFEPILTVLGARAEAEIRSTGLVALEKLEYTPEFLIEVLKDTTRSELARSYAAFMLGRMEAPEGLEPLIEALKAPEDEIRERAIGALGKLGDPRAWKPLIIAAHKDPSPTLRRKAQKTVESLTTRGRQAQDADSLVVKLKDPDPIKRREAAQALSRYGNWWSIRPLIEALRDPDEEVRRFSARALGDLQDKRAVGPLCELVKVSSGLTKQTAIIALGVLKDDAAVETVADCLEEADAKARQMAARALALIKSGLAGPALTEALKDIVPENRREVARALGEVAYPGALPALLEVVKDDVEANQIEATRAMGKIGSEGIPYLMRILDDRNVFVALTAVNALSELGAEEALPKLEQLARRHKDKYLREEALQATVEIKGKLNRKQEGADREDGGKSN